MIVSRVFSLWGVETPKLGKNKEPYTVLGKHRLLLHIDTLTSDQSSSQNSRNCNLGQNLLRHITKIPTFCTHPDKNAYCRKFKDCFPPPLLQCCLQYHKKCTIELLSRNNIASGVGRGSNLFLLDTMVTAREIENCIEMSQQFCPGL